MRAAWITYGIGMLILFGGTWLLVNHKFTRQADNESITGSSQSNSLAMATSSTLTLTSNAFLEGGSIPMKYACDGQKISVPLTFGGVPEGTKSLALIAIDPDVPKALMPGGEFVHWVLFNISPNTSGIVEGQSAGVAGANGAGQQAYAAPCPPKEHEPSEHRYIFTLYALDTDLALEKGATKDEVLSAMEGHVLAEVALTGRYKKQ